MKDLLFLVLESLPWIAIVSVALILTAMGELGKSLRTDQLVLAVLGLIGGIALAQLIDRVRLFHRMDSKIQKIDQDLPIRTITGLAKFNKSRSEFGDLSDWISNASKEIFVTGGALTNTIGLYGQSLIRKAENGCRVKLLLMNPYAEDGKHPNPVAKAMSDNYNHVDFSGAIRNSLRDLEHLSLSMSDRARKNLEVRLYSCGQTLSMIMVDDDDNARSGRMGVEILVYGSRTRSRPSLEFTQSSELFAFFRDAYRIRLWNKSREWKPKEATPVEDTDGKTLQE